MAKDNKLNNNIKEVINALESRINAVCSHDYGIYHHVALIWGAGSCFKEAGYWNKSV